jgi:predicted ATPase/class 3 adenylate cyclase
MSGPAEADPQRSQIHVLTKGHSRSDGLLTVLFTDIVGSTEFTASRGDESARAIRAEHDRLVREQVVRHGGSEIQTTGDGFLITFGSVRRAIACACAIQDAQQQHNRRYPDRALRVRVGLHAGEVSLRDDGLFGSAVNLAARVMARAGPDQIFVSDVVKQMAGKLPDVEFRDRGRVRLKGFPDRWRLHQLLSTGTDAGGGEAPGERTPRPKRTARRASDGQALPSPRSSFLGREDEVPELAQLLASNRLLTLTGPGGVGKTRLAIEVARLLSLHSSVVARFADVSGVVDAGSVDEAVLAAVGLHADPDHAARELLVRHLRSRRSLLVLDNCEQVIEASADLLEHLLDRCGELHVLVTSREPLMLQGEHVRHVLPLELPPPDAPLTEDAVRRHAALHLFIERAREAGAPSAIPARDMKVVVEICRRLDGLPLALELAAARMRTMAAGDLLAQLDQQRFGLLTAGLRTADLRHRTLRATVEWSYRLLTEEERLVFARLSIFAGRFDLSSAVPVAGQPPIASSSVPGVVSGLVDKSLVNVVGGHDGQTLYRMLDTLRVFGQERLHESGEHEATRRRQAQYYADRFAEPMLTWTRSALEGTQDQLDDVRSALDWSCTHEPQLAGLICPVGFWGRQGHLGEGCQWIERLIGRLPNDDAYKATAYADASWLAQRLGSYDRAERYGLEELRIARQLDDDWAEADALKRLADCARNRGDCELAITYGGESVAMRRGMAGRAGNELELAMSLMVLGSARGRGGDLGTGRANLQEAIEIFASVDEISGVAISGGWLGELYLREGDCRQAREQLLTSLRVFRDVPDAWMLANVFDLLAWLASIENDDSRVLRLTEAAAALRERIGAARPAALREPLTTSLRKARSRLGAELGQAPSQAADADPEQTIAYALQEV